MSAGLLAACGVDVEIVDREDERAVDPPPAEAPPAVAPPAIAQRAYVKASNIDAGDAFGYSVAVSADGSTLAISAVGEASAAKGVGGDQTDNSAEMAGAVYVFTRSGAAWQQMTYLKASNTGVGHRFGHAIALSADGATLAVGAPGESGAPGGNDGKMGDMPGAGAAYVFVRDGASWQQAAYVKAPNTDAHDHFGHSVALSADGSTLAVGAVGEASLMSGSGGDPTDDSAPNAGAVYVLARSGDDWVHQAYVKAANADAGDAFGHAVALSADGDTLAVGAPFEDSAATGVNGDPADQAAPFAGAVYVFARDGVAWSQRAYVKASNTGAGDTFGYSVALSADGETLAVGAVGEAGEAPGPGDQASDAEPGAGAVYVFTGGGAAWTQAAYVKASNPGAGDAFGHAVALSADGCTLAAGAIGEDSAATGVGGAQVDEAAAGAGAVYLFAGGAAWSQRAYVKASNPGTAHAFGGSVALSDAGALFAGAHGEAGAGTGIGGTPTTPAATSAGAAYAFQ